jgi:hypothetical protein
MEIRFWRHVNKDGPNGCWKWTGTKGHAGHGLMYRAPHKKVAAHRFSYVLHGGVIPEGLVLDHLCRNTNCVNPAHLEPVTRGENTLRGDTITGNNLRKTHCKRGHPFTPENLWAHPTGARRCKTCESENQRKRRARKAMA